MFNKLFKKDSPSTDDGARKGSGSASARAKSAQTSTAQTPAKTKPDEASWQAKLAAAMGDDNALLALAREAPILAVKEAAVAAIQSELALKEAEREFRQHDRRIHRDVKHRLEHVIATRTARESADALIAAARALEQEDVIPANKLVEIDRAWRELDGALLTPAQTIAFAEAETAISQALRARGDKQVAAKRWLARADVVETSLRSAAQASASGANDQAHLAAEHDIAVALMAEAIDMDDESAIARDVNHKKSSIDAAIQLARVIDARLRFLNTLSTQSESNATDGGVNAEWHALPAIPAADAAQALNARFETWRQLQAQRHDAQTAAQAKMNAEARKALQAQSRELLGNLIAQTEAALAAGNIVDANAQLIAIDEASKTNPLDKKQRAQVDHVRAEIIRLRGWQKWGGGRVRDDLVLEAEALARASTAEKLSLKAHGDAIENLRERWKALDKQGGATSRQLWLRFDGALKTAFVPVAANLAKLKDARNENLAKRNALIDALDAFALPESSPDWRAIIRTLEHFNTEWRKLGPIEHTVPHKSRDALLQRMKAAESRLQSPLDEARRIEALKREKLIASAKALAGESKKPEALTKARTLQEEWQVHAKTIPLARTVENKLWGDFKAAIDAIYAERKAEFAARDAALVANQTAREELIGRLSALDESSAPADIRRVLNEVDHAWRKAGEAPRNIAAKLDARFRQVRSHAQELASSSQQRTWSKVVDALDARRAALRDVESNPSALNDDWQTTWEALPSVPKTWQAALDKRIALLKSGNAITTALNADETLLKLEAALDIASPPAYRAARMALKLQAMKNAIEARQTTSASPTELDALFADALAKTPFASEAEMRLAAIINVVRKKPLA